MAAPAQLTGPALALWRIGYRLLVVSGARAALNRLRADRRSVPPALHGLDRAVYPGSAGRTLLRVHPRPHPRGRGPERRFAMLTLRTPQPHVARLATGFLARTGHFGCGQLEIGVFEEDGQLTVHAVRNASRASARLLRWRRLARRLGSEAQDHQELCALVRELERRGIPLRFADPAACVDLSLDPRLVHPAALEPVRRALESRYRRLHRFLANHPPAPISE